MKGLFSTATTADGGQKLTKDRVFWVHDLDGVHHNYDGIPNIYEFYARMKILTIRPHFPHLSDDEIFTYGMKSYKETGDGMLLFCEYARERGMAEKEVSAFRQSNFRIFHQHAIAYMREFAPNVFVPRPAVIASFERLKPHIMHGLLTQSCGIHWGRPILSAQQKIGYFNPDAIIDFADMGYITKAKRVEPLAGIMSIMGARPEQVVFIEDSLENLERAKELDQRILTVYVCRDLPLSPLPGYVDLQVRSVDDLLRMAADLYPQVEPKEEMRFTV